MPMTPFMGVRISWLMLARNSLLARLAASAASLAWCNSVSVRLRPVMSRDTPNVPTMSPFRSRSGILVVETQVAWPSGQTSFSSRPTTGRPVRMTSCSSRQACSACSAVKKSTSVRPTASAGSVRPKRAASARLTRVNRLSASLK